MPSFQNSIYVPICASQDSSKFALIAFGHGASSTQLRTDMYLSQLTYPMVCDSASQAFTTFKVGVSGNNPPTYVLVDKKEVVRYRSDGHQGITNEIKTNVMALLAEP